MAVDDAHAERLVSLASSASQLTSDGNSIQSLYASALANRAQVEREEDEKYLSLAPTFLSLHQQAASSKELLSSLESFLSTFQSDLSTLSTHISALQNTSHQIDSRLDATRDVEIQLASILSEIALSPRIVDLFFETDPESRPELWLKAVKQLERVLEAISPSSTLTLPSSTPSGSRSEEIGDIQAVKEVRNVAESCKNVMATKLRTYLTAPHSSIKASVTTNLQVLQTSVLLRHHRPLYAFLARQMPRVAIDVQRSYVAAARLYFETAFRRYARSLGVVRKRWAESSTAGHLITDPIPSSSKGEYASSSITSLQNGMQALSKAFSSSSGAANFFPPGRQSGGVTPARTGSNDGSSSSLGDAEAMNVSDPWLYSSSRMLYSKLDSPVATVLGYLADETSFKACPENLFRSLSLVLVDNACSEYTFLVRFFEGISEDDSSATPKTEKKGGEGGDGTVVGLGPEESASAHGDDTVDDEAGPEASVVQLSLEEQKRLKGRGASEEIFKQIFDPALSTFTTFTKSLLNPSSSSAASSLAASATSVVSGSGVSLGASGYFSLLSMLTLNDALLNLVASRGCSNAVLESALMGVKLSAYPLIKRFLDDQIAAIAAITNPGSSNSGSGAGGLWGAFGNLTGTSVSSSSVTLTAELGRAIAIRYASLFTKTLWILQDSQDPGILTALNRLRSELAKLFSATSASGASSKEWGKAEKLKSIKTLLSSIEAVVGVSGGGLSSHTKVQNEFSFWNEAIKNMST